jgi:hypothetical protein
MKLWKNFAFAIVLIALAVSCKSYRQAPEDTIKVLAVTSKGDTIQLDVNSLRPRVYQTIYHNYPYYYNYWRPSPFYFNNSSYYYQGSVIRPNYRPNNSNSTQSGSGPNMSSPNVSMPPSRPITKPSNNTNQNKGRKKDGN